MRFALLNLSGIDQTYHYTGIPIVFEVCSADTTVCTSIDGLLFPQVVLGGVVRNGETFQATWQAPHSIARGSLISLAPGTYQANIRHGGFCANVRVAQTTSVQFTVTP